MKPPGTALVVRSAPSQAPAKTHQSLEDAIRSFRSVLTLEQKAELDRVKSVPDANAVLTFTAQLDAQRRNARGRSIASRLCSILQSIRDYSTIIDTFVSSNPVIAALVWGSVKLTMLVVINYASHYEALSELFMDLGQICPHFEQYQVLFPSSTGVQSALSEFHASIIRCCQHVVEVVRRPWHAQVYFSFWSSFQQEFKPNVDEIKRNCTAVERELNLARAQAEHKSHQLQAVERGEAAASRRWLDQVLQRTGTHIDEWKQEYERQQARERTQALLKSLSDFDYLNPLKQNRRKRSSRTAKWVFGTPEYDRWFNGVFGEANFSLLWCYGKIGSGKTILLTSVIDHLLVEKHNPQDLVAFFFPRFDDAESLRAETILRSIAVQMLKSSTISGDALKILATVESAPSFDAYHLMALMKSIFKPSNKYYPQTFYIVIDGIDECNKQDQNTLLRTLSSMESITSETQAVRIFITCRHPRENSISDLFPHVEDIHASSGPAASDIAVFIDEEIQDLEASGELVVGDKDIIQDIKRFLFKHADGMFLWVTLALREICYQRCDEDVREVLKSQNLPDGLPEMFARTLSRIVSHNNEKIAKQILPWIIAAKEPLTLDQIAESALIKTLQANAQPGRRINGIHHIGAWFNGLVEVDEERKTVHFAHASIRHFLLGSPVKRDLSAFHINLDDADHHLGEVCVTYLNFGNFQTALAQRRRELIHLLPKDIAKTALAQEWSSSTASKLGKLISDARLPSASENVDRAILKLQSDAALADDTTARYPFLKYAASKWVFHTSSFNDKRSKSWSLWRTMLVNGHGVARSPVSGDILPALNKELVDWAFDQRHAGILSALKSPDLHDHIPSERIIDLSRNGDIELLSLVHRTDFPSEILLRAVKAASRKGNLQVVELLLSGVSDHDVLVQLRKQAILCASGWGHLHLLQWLLSQGTVASFNVERGYGERSLLQIASQYGHVEVMRFLLDNETGPGVDSGTTREGIRAAFTVAVLNNQLDAAELLIRYGANVNEANGSQSALTVASAHGNADMVRLLLREGASVQRPNAQGASVKRRHGVFRHLGMPNLQPLEVAASGSHVPVIKQLLEAGAPLQWGGTEALECAAASGEIELVKQLLRLSARSYHLSLSSGCLQAAAKFDHCDIIKLFLDKGAPINSIDAYTKRTALETAVKFGHASTVQFLLESGAEFSGESMRSVIQIAKSRRDLAVINVLRKWSSSQWWEDFETHQIMMTVEIYSGDYEKQQESASPAAIQVSTH